MKIEMSYLDGDLSGFDLDDAQLSARRMAEYSPVALKAGAQVDRMFIAHPAFTSVLTALDRLFQLAKEVEVPQGMALIGPSGTGKTSVLSYFRQSLPPSSLFAQGLGAVYVRVPKQATTSYLISGLLRVYGYPFLRVTRDSLEARASVLFDAMRQKGTRMVMFDEAQHLVAAAGGKRRPQDEGTAPTDFIRQLIDDARISVVLSGVSALDHIEEVDEALAGRVVGCYRLERFKYDVNWVGLIRAFVKQTPDFDLQILVDPEINQQLFRATQGGLRNLKRLLTEVVLLAADRDQRVIDPALIARAYATIYGTGRPIQNPFEPACA